MDRLPFCNDDALREVYMAQVSASYQAACQDCRKPLALIFGAPLGSGESSEISVSITFASVSNTKQTL